MPLDTYASLQASVLGWLARPGDPLVAPAVADMVRLFEAEANRRLRVDGAQANFVATATPGLPGILLPADFQGLRSAYVSLNGAISKLAFLPPTDDAWASLITQSGRPIFQNAGGGFLELGPAPDNPYQVSIDYTRGVPPLGHGRGSNWLLAGHPDAYLFGTLAEAEAYIGHDERIALWLQRREAAFASIEQADRKLRWSGGPLQIRVDGITGPGGSGGGSGGAAGGGTPPPGGSAAAVTVSEQPPPTPQNGDLWFDLVSAQTFCWIDDFSSRQWVPVINQAAGMGAPAPAMRVLAPASGTTVTLPVVGRYYVNNAAVLPALTIRLPLGSDGDNVEVGFARPVTALAVQDASGVPLAGAPTNAYGPGAALQFQYIGGGWVYWS